MVAPGGCLATRQTAAERDKERARQSEQRARQSAELEKRCNETMRAPAPKVVASSAGGHSTQSHSSTARIVGSSVAGVSELLVFHPVDTCVKRLMSNQSSTTGVTMGHTISNLNKVIFKESADKGAVRKWLSLFPGLGWGAAYKIMQRVYKFGGQPFVKDFFANNPAISRQFEQRFGEKHSKTLMHATAGSIIGVGEIALLPLDVLKIKAQTNPESIAGRGIVDIFTKEGRNLYRGAGWTAARNAPGSFALFGGAAFVKEYIFKLQHYGDATWFQDFCASVGGAMASITVAAPLDVVKTRVQNRPFDSPESGMAVVRNLIKNEGAGAFFKGLGPKLLVVGPKLVFSFTIAQHIISTLDAKLTGRQPIASSKATAPSTKPSSGSGGDTASSSSSSTAAAIVARKTAGMKQHLLEDTVPPTEEHTVREAAASAH